MKKLILIAISGCLCLCLCACGNISADSAAREVTDALVSVAESYKELNEALNPQEATAAVAASADNTSAVTEQKVIVASEETAVSVKEDAEQVSEPTAKPVSSAKSALVKKNSAASESTDTPSSVIGSLLANSSSSDSSELSGAFGTSQDPTKADMSVLKSPTSETIPWGGTAIFIAHASNEKSITWLLASPDNSTIIKAADAPYVISGLKVTGASDDTLVLSNVPLSMTGWKVQARFDDGTSKSPLYSGIATVTVYQVVYVQAQPVSCASRLLPICAICGDRHEEGACLLAAADTPSSTQVAGDNSTQNITNNTTNINIYGDDNTVNVNETEGGSDTVTTTSSDSAS